MLVANASYVRVIKRDYVIMNIASLLCKKSTMMDTDRLVYSYSKKSFFFKVPVIIIIMLLVAVEYAEIEVWNSLTNNLIA